MLVLASAAALLGCSSGGDIAGGGAGNGGGGNGAGGTTGPSIKLDAPVVVPPTPVDEGADPKPCPNPTACPDFPTSPIIDPRTPSPVPSDPGSQFTGSPSGSGPCVTEPEDGALYPYNWTRPRIKWSGTSGLVQITVHADLEANDLVVYTMGDNWIMDTDVWKGLAKHVHEQDVSVTVRGAGGGATTVKFQIASASASGSIVFWAADPAAVGNQNVTTVQDTSSYLRGFSVGEEGTVVALKFSQVKQSSREQSYNTRTPTCMGCHAATPDPGFVSFVDNWPWNSVISGVKSDNVGAALPNLTTGGLAALNKPWAGAAAFSLPHWQAGKRMMVTTSAQQNDSQPWSTDNKQPAKLVWYNLDGPDPTQSVGQGPLASLGQQYGVITRTGDSNCAAFPTWSHGGDTIVYSSSAGGCMDGRLEKGATDLYQVPYNGGNGGEAKPVPGASESAYEEYYAAYSPDDQLVVFDRIPAGGVMYANNSAEIYVVPMGSAPGAGKAIRLAANDPVKCTGKSSPGLNNHFPKWAPLKADYQGQSYYWVVYSSNRAGIKPVRSSYDGKDHEVSQLYLTAITLKDGQYKTYPSIYLWNQPTDSVNTTPVWDTLAIPPAPPIF